MIQTPFKLTESEVLCSAAATLCLHRLAASGVSHRRLEEIAENPQYGFTASATDNPTSTRFLRITDIKGGSVEWSTVPFCECERPASYLLKPGDLLIARSGSVGKSFLVVDVPEPTVFASYMIRIRAKSGLVPEFAFWCFQSQQFWEQLLSRRRGSAMANINGQMLSALEFPLPGESLQRTIAEFLNDFRLRLQGREVSLGKLPPPLNDIPRMLEQIEEIAGQIQEARTLRLAAFADANAIVAAAQRTLVTELTHRFNTVAIGSFGDVRGGKRLPNGESLICEDTGHPYLRAGNLKEGTITGEIRYLLPHVQKSIASYIVQAGDIYITIVGACIGDVGIIPEAFHEANLTENAAKITIREETEVEGKFLVHALRSPPIQEYLLNKRTIAAQPKLALHRIRSTKIPLPPVHEQRRIVAELDAMEAEVEALKGLQAETAVELDALLPSILDKAFKGEL